VAVQFPVLYRNSFVDDLTRHLLAARDGDRAAFGSAVRRSQADVGRYCAHLVGRGDAGGRTWLLAIARRACADAGRSRRIAFRAGRRRIRAGPELRVEVVRRRRGARYGGPQSSSGEQSGQHGAVNDHEMRAAIGRGDYLVAYDLAMRAASERPDDAAVRYLAVLALARAGATDRAAEQLAVFGLDGDAPAGAPTDLVEDLGALRARLAKDAAMSVSGEERARRAGLAAQLYETTYRALDRPFAGVNAATMWSLAGDQQRSHAIATEVLSLLASPADGEDVYWTEATRAEALLLLGAVADARVALRHALATVPDIASRATTRRQLALVCELVGCDAGIVDVLEIPQVVHYTGHLAPRLGANAEDRLADQIAARLEAESVGFGYGALACGADLIVAEALLARGAELHVVFPCAQDDFVRVSVAPGGLEWVHRFEDALARAASVTYATEGPYLGAPELFAFGAEVAMGKALLRASYLATTVSQLAVWDGKPAAGPAGTAVDISAWERTGCTRHVISVDGGDPRANGKDDPAEGARSVRAMIFADVQGFSRLSEGQVPAFVDHVLSALAATIDSYADAVRFRNTWGDGIYLVFDDVAVAARCALALQDTMRSVDLAALGLPPLALRVGAHAGPVFEQIDPITGVPGFFGVEVTRTARVEPGTPPGAVYVTDPFAALVALDGLDELSCQYVGPVPTAKGFGTFPLYTLRRRG